jgi:1-acyl-sn-glycerol-3-phosphate acyltransferase
MRIVASFDLKKTDFKFDKIGMERLAKGENALYLMNHSSFIDLEIVARMLFPKPFNIITTSDAFVGKDYLLRHIGCIPTKKFVSDPTLVRDAIHAAKKQKSNVVLFPEAGYSFDGTATTLPDTLGKFIKMLGIPLVMITTYGAFARDPLYNNIQVRDVDVSAKMEYLLSSEEISEKSAEEINDIVKKCFSFDNFRWQAENNIKIDEPTRADYLNRVLYKCSECGAYGDRK